MIPLSDKLPLDTCLELSNGDFKKIIESDMKLVDDLNLSKADKLDFLKRSAHPVDYLLVCLACIVYKVRIVYKKYDQVVSDEKLPEGWVLLTTAHNKDASNHYFGAAYWNSKHRQVVIVHRGTVPKLQQRGTWKTDFYGILHNSYVPQMYSAITFANQIMMVVNELNEKHNMNLQVSFTGHSLGGWLAQITTFATKYFTLKTFQGGNKFFVKSDQMGYHAHTVVFDSPGCQDMLLQMKRDFDVRYQSSLSIFSFDITIYLSAPNLVNTCRSHVETSTIYRVFIEDLPPKRSRTDFMKYTKWIHDVEKIKKALVPNEGNHLDIKKVIDWPLVKKGITKRTCEMLSDLICKGVEKARNLIFKRDIFKRLNENEYEYFHIWANYVNKYNPEPDDEESYCTIRYQVQDVDMVKCSINIFTQPEFNFLNVYQKLREFEKHFKPTDLFSSLGKKNAIDETVEILKTFKVEGNDHQGKIISCESPQKLINHVKNMLYLFPEVEKKVKHKLEDHYIRKAFYELDSNDYLSSIEKVLNFREYVFEEDMMNLNNFLKCDKQVLQWSIQIDSSIGANKVYNILKNTNEQFIMQKYSTRNHYTFLDLEGFLNLDRHFTLTQFLGGTGSDHLLVIECKNSNELNEEIDEYVQIFFESLFTTLKDNPSLKLILITQGSNNLSNFLKKKGKELLGNRYESENDAGIKFSDLTEGSQGQFLKEMVLFQGKDISYDRLIKNKESKFLVNAEVLSKLINNVKIEIGDALQDIGNVQDYYISRTFNRQTKIKKDFEKEKSKFCITSSSQVDELKPKEHVDIVLTSDTDEGSNDFEKLCNKYEEYNIHWLKKEGNELVWQQSYGHLSKLPEFVDKSGTPYTYKPEKITDIADKIVLVAAEPGMGKSTVLTRLAVQTKESDPALWVVRIDLVDCLSKLIELSEGKVAFDKERAFEFLLEVTKLKTTLEKELFNDFYNQGNIVFLFNGFDEISSECREKVIELLKILKGTKVERIWVTTRPYGILSELEDELCVFSFTMKPFSREDQDNFLKGFWERNLKLNEVRSERSEIFINELLHKFSQSTNDQKRNFVSIPLQIRMIATVFQDTFKEFYDSNEPELSCKQKQKLSEKLNLVTLYDDFFKIKFNEVYIKEKNTDLHANRAKNKKFIEAYCEKSIEEHKMLALYGLFGSNGLETLLPGEFERSLKGKDKLIERIEQGEEDMGIIDRVVGGKPIFVHLTFAEYFAALWFTDDKNLKKHEVKDFLLAQSFTEKNQVLRSFFDSILTKDEGENKYEIHTAVLNNDEKRISELLSDSQTAKAIINVSDKGGRTALHLAAAYGYSNIVQLLLKYKANIHIKDNVFGWTPLSYADKTSRWNVAELLLAKGANGDDMVEAIRSINVNNGVVNGRQETLLHVAAHAGYVKFAEVLVNKGTNINAVEHYDNTPLHWAARNGNLGTVEYLVGEEKINVNALDKDGWTPALKAAYSYKWDIAKYLIRNRADVNAVVLSNYLLKTRLTLLRMAIRQNRWALEQDQLHIVQYLVEQGADVKIADQNGWTAALEAAHEERWVIVKYLIENGANINATSKTHHTLLGIASEQGQWDMVQYLVEQGADVNIANQQGWTPALRAAHIFRWDIVKYFIGQGANIKAIVKCCGTLLDMANKQFRWFVEKIKLNILLEYPDEQGADVNVADGCTSALVAALVERRGKLTSDSVIDLWYFDKAIRIGEDILILESTQGLFATIENNNYNESKIVNKLQDYFKNGAIAGATNNGFTLLHTAVLKGYKEVVKMLLKHIKQNNPSKLNSFVNVKTTAEGTTSLHVAAQNNKKEIIEILLKNGAHYDVKNKKAETPLDIAELGSDVKDLLSCIGNLFRAVKNGEIDEVNSLLEGKDSDLDAILNARNSVEETLLQVARANKQRNIERLLGDKLRIVQSSDQQQD